MTQPIVAVNEERLFAESFERVLPRIQAVSLSELMPVNLEVTTAVSTVLGALPEITALRPRIVEELPRYELTDFDQLEEIARALSYAHTQFVTSCAPADDLQALAGEGTRLREVLRGDAEQLVRRGLVNGQALREVSSLTGYKNLVRDLQILVTVLREAWPQIQGKCATDLEELALAERTAARLLRVVGLREQAPTSLSTVAETRQRAFTLFWRTYDEVRRALWYLRWREGDADAIAPSLYAGRGGRRRSPEPDAALDPAPLPGALPGNVPSTPPLSGVATASSAPAPTTAAHG